MNLQDFRVQSAPPTIYYVPNFIDKEEEEFLLSRVYAAPKPKWTQLSHRKLQNWGGLPHPKGMIAEALPPWLQSCAERIATLGVFEDKVPNHVLVNEYLPGQGIMPHEDGSLFYPTVSTISLGSHTMLDFYYHLQGQASSEYEESACEEHPTSCQSISSSGTSQVSVHGVSKTVSLSCDSTTSFEDRYFLSILLEPRSLILVCDDMYKLHLHGIAERTIDEVSDKVANLDTVSAAKGTVLERKSRVSLTIRHVPKVLKAKVLFGKR